MPVYEGIGLISEKHAVVLDLGAAYTKAGFAGETGPRCIIPSRVVDPKTKKIVNIMDYTSADHLYCLLTEFIYRLYFKYLLVNPKDRRVVITESIFSPTVFRETLAKVLFMHYEVSSVLFTPSALMALHTLGIPSALVMDFGYVETTVTPVFEGVVMVNVAEDHIVGGELLHNRLRSLLIEHSTVKMGGNVEAGAETVLDALTDEVIEDIKVRICFVTPLDRARQLAAAAAAAVESKAPTPPPSVDYPLKGFSILHIPGTVRELVSETLFERDGEEKSLATLVLNSIIKCPTDMRKCLAENIVVMGGSAMIPGFKHRLLAEIRSLLNEPYYKNRTAIKTFKFHSPPAKENYIAWLGAAIFSATDAIVIRSVTKEQYVQRGGLPDWSNHSFSNGSNDGKSI